MYILKPYTTTICGPCLAPFVQVNVAMLVDLLLGQSGYSEKGQPLLAVVSGSNDYSKSPLSKVTLADIL